MSFKMVLHQEIPQLLSIEIAKIMDLIREGNRLMQKQAEERYEFLKSLIARSDLSSEKGQEVLKMIISELINLQNDFHGLNIQKELISLFSESVANERIQELIDKHPHLIELLNQGFSLKEALAQEILRQEANLMARDELISILEEDIQLMESENSRLSNDVQNMENEIHTLADKVHMLEKLFLHSPKFKAVEIISKHPEGLSYTQLSYLLNIPINEAIQLAIELEQNYFVSRYGNIIKPLVGEFVHPKI